MRLKRAETFKTRALLFLELHESIQLFLLISSSVCTHGLFIIVANHWISLNALYAPPHPSSPPPSVCASLRFIILYLSAADAGAHSLSFFSFFFSHLSTSMTSAKDSNGSVKAAQQQDQVGLQTSCLL